MSFLGSGTEMYHSDKCKKTLKRYLSHKYQMKKEKLSQRNWGQESHQCAQQLQKPSNPSVRSLTSRFWHHSNDMPSQKPFHYHYRGKRHHGKSISKLAVDLVESSSSVNKTTYENCCSYSPLHHKLHSQRGSLVRSIATLTILSSDKDYCITDYIAKTS